MSFEPSTLELERSIYVVMHWVALWLLVYLTFHSVALLVFHRKPDSTYSRKIYIWFSIIMLFVMTFAVSLNLLVGQLIWVEHRDYPGGPTAYFYDKGASWYNVTSSAAGILGDFMSNALLLYRCFIIWHRDWRIIIFPFLLYLTSIAMALLSLVESALPTSGFFAQQAVNFSVPWISLTCGLNVTVTCLIAGRILYLAKGVREILPEASISIYTGIVAVLVESALPFSIVGIVFAVVLGEGLPEAYAFTVVWGALVAISPQFIILRIALGRGWTDETVSQFSGSISFALNPYHGQMSTTTARYGEGSDNVTTRNGFGSNTLKHTLDKVENRHTTYHDSVSSDVA